MLRKNERLPKEGFAGLSRAVSFAYGSFRFSRALPPRAAVVMSKKTLPSSVDRHRAKRRILAVLRRLLRSGALKRSVVIYPNARALSASASDLRGEVEKALTSG